MQGYYYEKLNVVSKKAYDKIVRAIKNRAKEVQVNVLSSDDDFSSVLQAIRYEYPEFFYVDFNHLRYYKTILGFIWQIGYSVNTNTQKIIEIEIQKVVDDILSGLTGINSKSDIKKIRYLHNYLLKNVSYNYDALSNPDAFPESFGIDGALIQKKAVCEGVSKTFKFLCDKIGVDCLIVGGKASLESIGHDLSHAWNIVKIQNQYTHVDVTWDIGVSQLCKRNRYDYFCVPDSWISIDHDYDEMPICISCENTYFYNKKVLFNSITNLKNYLIKELNRQSNVIYFRVEGKNLPKDFSKKINELVKKTAAMYVRKSYTYEIVSNEEQNCYYYRFNYF
ncbi:MAG: transglutaminase domain-containing protein [Ruminococcus sp.]|nr:transglutaminase domain-containing protein [Ruminococcus sp.]